MWGSRVRGLPSPRQEGGEGAGGSVALGFGVQLSFQTGDPAWPPRELKAGGGFGLSTGPCGQASGGGAPEDARKLEEGKEEAVRGPCGVPLPPWLDFHAQRVGPHGVVPLKEVRTGSFSGSWASKAHVVFNRGASRVKLGLATPPPESPPRLPHCPESPPVPHADCSLRLMLPPPTPIRWCSASVASLPAAGSYILIHFAQE